MASPTNGRSVWTSGLLNDNNNHNLTAICINWIICDIISGLSCINICYSHIQSSSSTRLTDGELTLQELAQLTSIKNYLISHLPVYSQSTKDAASKITLITRQWIQSFIVLTHDKWMIYSHRSRLRSFLHPWSAWSGWVLSVEVGYRKCCLFEITQKILIKIKTWRENKIANFSER